MSYQQPQLFNINQYKTITSTYLSSLEDEIIEPLFHSNNTSSHKASNTQSRDSQSLKYSDISHNSEQLLNINEIDEINQIEEIQIIPTYEKGKEDISIRLQTNLLDNSEEETQQLISTRRYHAHKSRLSLYKGIESLEEHLEVIEKELRIKDNAIKDLEGDYEIVVKSFCEEEKMRKEADEKLLECECRVLELENIIIRHNIKEGIFEEKGSRCNGWGRRVEEEMEWLRREKKELEMQLKQQNQLIIQYQMEKEVIQKQNSVKEFVKQMKSLNSQTKCQFLEQIKQLKTDFQSCIASLSTKYSTLLSELSRTKTQSQQSYLSTIHSLQSQITHLKSLLPSSNLSQQSKPKHQSTTDIKSSKVSKHKRESLTDLCIDYNNFQLLMEKEIMNIMNTPSQPTKMLKKQIMNAGRCINVVVNENQVVKEVGRRSVQKMKEGKSHWRCQ